MAYTVAEIARHLDGEVVGDGEVKLTGFAPANTAREGDLTFAENETYFQGAEASAASAILVDGHFTSKHKALIRVSNARIAFAKVLPFFFPEPEHPPGIHPTAVVAKSAQIDPSVHIGPFCVIEDGTQIGPRTVLQGNNHIGSQSQLGESVRLYPRVVVYPRGQIGDRVRIHSGSVIGSDGFGYVVDQGVHRKIPQVGTVQIHEDVEIGANVTIDRGALGATVIGKGTKIDNLVQIAHNVVIGEHCILVAQGGIAGSTKIGNYTTLAGQVGIAGHVKIGNHVTVAAQSGIMHDIPDGEKWFGSPAQPSRQMMRQIAHLQKLPDLVRRLEELEKQIAAMQNSGQSTSSDSH